MSSNSAQSGAGSGRKLGNKLKGAAQVVHGIGESIRGTVLGAVDSIAHTPSSEAKYEATASKGKAEIEEGIAKVRGHASGGNVGAPGEVHSAPGGGGEQTTGGGTLAQSATTTATTGGGVGAAAAPSGGGLQSGRKEGEKKEGTPASGAYEPTPPSGAESFPEKGPQPQPVDATPISTQRDGESASSGQPQPEHKPLPERPRGRIFTGVEEYAEREPPEKLEFADEKPESKEPGQVFMGSRKSTGSIGAEGAEGRAGLTRESPEAKKGGQLDSGEITAGAETK
ncbi:hypothetical protein J3A83DRAFT_4368674 [Scleroderma citrinum]